MSAMWKSAALLIAICALAAPSPAQTLKLGDAGTQLIAGLKPHPRMHMDAALLQQIRELRKARHPYWVRFENYIRTMPDTSAFPASVINSYLLAWIVTGERRYFEDGAWRLVKRGVYDNGADRSGGIKTLLEYFRNDAHEAAFLGGQYIAMVAQLYDWCGPLLSPEQKQDLIDWMNQACEYTYHRNSNALARFRNDGAAAMYGLAAAAYATLGDNPKAPIVFSWFRDWWKETLEVLDIMGKGGASGEGNGYGNSPTGFSFIRTANLAWFASGEDLFVSHPWFRQRLLYDAFSVYPTPIGGPGAPGGYPEVPIRELAMIGGDGRHGSSLESRDLRLRQNGLVLSRRFAGTEEAVAWNWVFRQPEVDHAPNAVESYSDLLYYSPRPELKKPSRLSFFDPSMGFVYIRSDWDSPDATWIAFWAGPHLDTHQHLDQGAFTIFKRRALAPKTGHYDAIRGGHQLAWYTRTISSNGLLIGDPRESFRGFIGGMGCDPDGTGSKVRAPDGSGDLCPPNDGGQRTMFPFSLAPRNPELFRKNAQVFDVARVLSFRDDGESVSVVADITHAYNSRRFYTPGNRPKAEKVYRRLVYLRKPDVLVVADTVESIAPEFQKRWLLHSLDRLQVSGAVEQVSEGESVHTGTNEAMVIVDDNHPSDRNQTTFDLRHGAASLHLRTVFPRKFRYRVIGGREPADVEHSGLYERSSERRAAEHFHRHIKDFWIRDFSAGVLPFHKSTNWPPERPTETSVPGYVPVFAPGYGRTRLEIEPGETAATALFLNILKPSVQTPQKAPESRPLEDPKHFGAEFTHSGRIYRVTFEKESLGPPEITVR